MRVALLPALLIALASPALAQHPPAPVRAYGIQISVLDMPKALEFYGKTLGFELESGDATSNVVVLKADSSTRLQLSKVRNLPPVSSNEATPGLTLQIHDIDSTIARLRANGVEFADKNKRKEGVGNAISIRDPFGTRISLMQQTVGNIAPFREPAIYNYGFLIPNMDSARAFYEGTLGFTPMTQRYLPLDMPLLHADKSFAFMLHYREGVEGMRYNTTTDERVVVLFSTPNLDSTIASLSKLGVVFKNTKDAGGVRSASFYDPFGYLSELVEVK